MRRQKIKILTNTNITNIKIINNKIVSLQSDKNEIFECDKLVFNGDPPVFYKEIFKSKKVFKRKKFLPEFFTKYSMGMFVLYFGTKKKYPKVAHHTIWLGKRFKALLNDIFEKKILADDFSLYLHRPTATDKTFAPKGCDVFIHVPYQFTSEY